MCVFEVVFVLVFCVYDEGVVMWLFVYEGFDELVYGCIFYVWCIVGCDDFYFVFIEVGYLGDGVVVDV